MCPMPRGGQRIEDAILRCKSPGAIGRIGLRLAIAPADGHGGIGIDRELCLVGMSPAKPQWAIDAVLGVVVTFKVKSHAPARDLHVHFLVDVVAGRWVPGVWSLPGRGLGP